MSMASSIFYIKNKITNGWISKNNVWCAEKCFVGTPVSYMIKNNYPNISIIKIKNNTTATNYYNNNY